MGKYTYSNFLKLETKECGFAIFAPNGTEIAKVNTESMAKRIIAGLQLQSQMKSFNQNARFIATHS